MTPWRYWPTMPLLLFCGILFPGLARADTDVSPRAVAYANTFHAAVCSTLDDYPSVAGVEGVVLAVMDQGLTPGEAGQVAALSVLGWCPEHTAVLKAFAGKWAPQQPTILVTHIERVQA